jgi:hypothetical protein
MLYNFKKYLASFLGILNIYLNEWRENDDIEQKIKKKETIHLFYQVATT